MTDENRPNPAKPARIKTAKKIAAPVDAVVTPPAPESDAPATEAPTVDFTPTEKVKNKDKAKDKAEGKDKKKHKKKKKEAVIIRFDDEKLPLIDQRAEALGLSRAAWVRMVVSQALKKSEV